jgi:hypothetical protein
MRKRSLRRVRTRGVTTVEAVLAICAVMGCFVYPLSVVMRNAGAKLVADSDRAHEALLNQNR